MSELPIVDRPSARLVILDEDDCVLLLNYRHFAKEGTLWVLPGGGVEDGETYEQAAIRELFEETGQKVDAPGPWIWQREHVWPYLQENIQYRSLERMYFLRLPRFELDLARSTELELEYLLGWRWWSRSDVLAATEETFVPGRLGTLLEPIVAGRLPETAVDTGV